MLLETMAAVGGGFQILGGIVGYMQQQIAQQGQIEQYGFTIADLEMQQQGNDIIHALQMEQFSNMSDYIEETAMNQQATIDSQLRQNESQQRIKDLELRQLENKGRTIDSQVVQQELSKDSVEAKKTINQLSVNKAEMHDALKKGDVRLARNAATREARLKTAVRKLSTAGQGRSGFAKAFEAMTVNSMASFDQQMTALEGEGLFRRSTFDQEMRQLGNESKSLDENITQLDLEKANVRAEKKINREGVSILQEGRVQLGIQSDQVESQMQYELDTAMNQQEQTTTQYNTNSNRNENSQEAAAAAQENIQDQIDIGQDPASGMGWNDSFGGRVGQGVSNAVGAVANHMF